ncbi:Na+/H+ antiporter subunit E [Leptospira interrogans]
MTAAKTVTAWIQLHGLFFRELVLSVKDVAATVLKPDRPIRSAIIAIPLDVKSDEGITLLANMITLTPGTTSLHVNQGRSTLYAHVMSMSDESVMQIKNGFERRVREVLS